MDILTARETRAHHIEKIMKEHVDKTIIVMKANVPGIDKNPKRIIFMCRYFHNVLKDTFGKRILEYHFIKSLDGDYTYYVVEEAGNMVKEKTILIEEENVLGKLIDLDVYNERAITRNDIECEMRKCLICENYAHVCVRNKTHAQTEVIGKVNVIINDFLTEFILAKVIKCIYYELDLYPKFGLVSSRDNGSHTDMSFDTFVQSIFAIKPFIRDFILYGINDLDNPLILKEIGIRAEKAMFEATNHVNTHKGLIFLLGIFLPVFTKAIIHQEDAIAMKKQIKVVANEIIGKYFDNMNLKTNLSHGDKIYLTYGLKGIRGQVLNGMNLIFECPSYQDKPSIYVYHEYLLYFMSRLDDTTIIHKNDMETLQEVKQTAKAIVEKGGYTENRAEVAELSKEYMKRNISPGGSADLLVVKIIFEELKYLLKSSRLEKRDYI
ncbi:MAG: citrate lyase holo-[acyl-carrier protein] synthase [Firmicutes bacterium]|nr:citrate lyase holo-[acyl-carrier protein] synthase [Bacillota bacterium]